MNIKVAFIIPSLSTGGAERVLSLISQNININHDIILLEDKDIVYDHKGNIIELHCPSKRNLVGKIANVLLRVLRLRKLKKNNNYDIVISFMESCNIINILTKRNEKCIITVHNHNLGTGLYGKIYNVLVKLFYNKADNIITVSDGIKNKLIKEYNMKKNIIKTIYNPIDLEEISMLLKEEIDKEMSHVFSEDNKIIITAGRLTYQKGQWDLIKAFSIVKNKCHNAKLVILGDGELRTELYSLTNILGLSNDVYFLGFQKNPFKYFYKSDLFVLSSLWEGFGNVLIEAAATGLPIISTDCQAGPQEIIQNKYGILTPPFIKSNIDTVLDEKHEFMAQRIIDLLINNNKKIKYSKLAKERAREFDINKIIKEWHILIKNVN